MGNGRFLTWPPEYVILISTYENVIGQKFYWDLVDHIGYFDFMPRYIRPHCFKGGYENSIMKNNFSLSKRSYTFETDVIGL